MESDLGDDRVRLGSEYDVITHPSCDLYEIQNLIKEEGVVRKLHDEIWNLSYTHNSSDLSCFSQSDEFTSIEDLSPILKNFSNLLRGPIRKIAETCFGVKTTDKLTITASLYEKGDFLLCHDDLMTTRCVAFVYYLVKDWERTDGGALRFFDHEGNEPAVDQYKAQIKPSHNSLVMFRVHQKSHHEVEEIMSDMKTRISINGWFHHEKATQETFCEQMKLFCKSPILEFELPFVSGYCKEQLINRYFILRTTMRDISEMFPKEHVFVGNKFLRDDFYSQCEEELMQPNLNWVKKGPANMRRYETLEYEVLTIEAPVSSHKVSIKSDMNMKHINELVNQLLSPPMLKILNRITKTEFRVLNEKSVPPACMVEIQRWKEGDYSLLSDHDVLKNMPSLELTVYFKVNKDIVESSKSENDGVIDPNGWVVLPVFSTPMSKRQRQKLHKYKIERMIDEWNTIKKLRKDKLVCLRNKLKRREESCFIKKKSPEVITLEDDSEESADSVIILEHPETHNHNVAENTEAEHSPHQYHKENGLPRRKKEKLRLKRLAWLHQCHEIICEKLDQLQQYRKSHLNTMNNYIHPCSNTMSLVYGDENKPKYTRYIKKKSKEREQQIAYYAVNVVYFITVEEQEQSL